LPEKADGIPQVLCYHDPMNALTWDDIIADRSLRHLPYKIETNKFNQIVMSPATFWHSDYQGEITLLLGKLLAGGKVPVECAIQTSEGVRVPDAAWISLERRAPHRRATVLPIAPEICVEVLSPSNSREQMLEKMMLYFAKRAEEVWLCDEHGKMEFFTAASAPAPVAQSLRCPEFPQQIDVD
jgi:Uma2 family endonuclease